jgi:DNA-binding transcriptional MerR regulator
MPLSQKRDLDSPVIPDRLYFKIGDVARICGVETYVLRFWETQFPQLKPNKSGTGQRLYRRRDVELALKIKNLVHGEGYTLSGARQVLEQDNLGQDSQRNSQAIAPPLEAAGAFQTPDSVAATIGHVRAELREIASLLALPSPPLRRCARLTTIPSACDSLFPTGE